MNNSMSPEKIARKKNNSPATAIHKFILLKKDFKNDLFCFYEGKDGPYYYNRIIHNYGNNHHPIICGNKKSVIRVYGHLSKTYPTYKTSFFIDSDFDKKLNKDNLYETPCYSIENFYTSEKVLKAILKNEFGLIETDEEFKSIIEIFNENRESFHSATTLLNSWYAAAKEKALTNGVSVNASLDEKPPKEFIIVKIGSINSSYNLNNILEKYPDSIKVTEEEVNQFVEKFDNSDKSKVFRGKYELDFMYKFLQFIIEDANVNKKYLKTKTKFNVDKSMILSQLSNYAETPQCLVEYLISKN